MNKKSFLGLALAFATFSLNASEVIRVTDGDTIVFDGVTTEEGIGNNIKCRIEGIDTPEKFSSKKLDKFAQKYDISIEHIKDSGKKASDYATNIFVSFKDTESGLSVTSDSLDVYKRNLCRVNLNGSDYGIKILEDGYAVVYKNGKYMKDSEYKLKLIQAQQRAIENKAGLWAEYADVMEAMKND